MGNKAPSPSNWMVFNTVSWAFRRKINNANIQTTITSESSNLAIIAYINTKPQGLELN